MVSRVSFPTLSIEYAREEIPVRTMSPSQVPDEEWRYIDKAGHGHFWNGKHLPTLEWVVTGKEWVGDEYDGDEYDVGEYRCLICGEVIKPKKKADYGSSHVSGLATYTVSIDRSQFVLSEGEWINTLNHLKAYLERNHHDLGQRRS